MADRRVEALLDRYDESTSRMLGDTAHQVSDKYGGDLRRLREAAERDVSRERQLLKEFKGIGDVGASIYFREVQGAWAEIYPFADEAVLGTARRLELGDSAADLARLVPRPRFPVLVAALVRAGLANHTDEILEEASS